MTLRYPLLFSMVALLAACASTPPGPSSPERDPAGAPGSDRYSMDQDTGPKVRKDVSQIPEPVPRQEPPSRYGNPESYTIWGKTYHVLPSAEGYREEGMASWYGQKFHGHRTSSGETFDMYRLTAAHPSLPIPTYVRVTNLDNDQSLVVRVNDRGPFHGNRIIDLSWAAAVRLGIEQAGTGRVKVEAITAQTRQRQPGNQVPTAVRAATDSPPPGQQRLLQAGAFRDAQAALALQRQLQDQLGLTSQRQQGEDGLTRIWLGPYDSEQEREKIRQQVEQSGFNAPLPIYR